MNVNISKLISRHATYRLNHLAVVFEDRRCTDQEFNRNVNRLANALVDLGIKKGAAVHPAELKAWINEHVGAKFQRVSEVLILDDFPRNIAGKTLKRVIRENFLADLKMSA
ncbi:MAG: hypothetical protein OEU55_13125 [Desulfobacterales bacterium]|jgi:acyl-coenzyme A synthetase/AMP-(fatty) acid ligase|nr:hypothetical protein [Desulfobacterales bacterium]MDH4011657.1 hypothetical protein [Desulfobacterales bacterium]